MVTTETRVLKIPLFHNKEALPPISYLDSLKNSKAFFITIVVVSILTAVFLIYRKLYQIYVLKGFAYSGKIRFLNNAEKKILDFLSHILKKKNCPASFFIERPGLNVQIIKSAQIQIGSREEVLYLIHETHFKDYTAVRYSVDYELKIFKDEVSGYGFQWTYFNHKKLPHTQCHYEQKKTKVVYFTNDYLLFNIRKIKQIINIASQHMTYISNMDATSTIQKSP